MSVIIRLQNLPWSANALDIRNYFRGLSIPEGGVHIVGGELGDAFIAFSTDEDARQAMMLDCGKIKEIQVKLLLSSRSEMHKVIEAARQTVPLLSLAPTPAPAPPPAPVPISIPQPAPPIITPFSTALGNHPLASFGIPGLGNPQEIPQPAVIEPPAPLISPSDNPLTIEEEKDDEKLERRRSRDRRRTRSRSRSRDRDRKDRKRDRRDRSRSRDRRRRDRTRSRDRRDRKRDRKDRSRSRDRSPSRRSRDKRRSPTNSQEKDILLSEGPQMQLPFTNSSSIPMPLQQMLTGNLPNGPIGSESPINRFNDPSVFDTLNKMQELAKKRNPNAFQGEPHIGNNKPGNNSNSHRGGRGGGTFRRDNRGSRFEEPQRGCSVAIRNAPNHTSYGDVRRFFPFMIDKHGIKMINDNLGRRTGNIFVRFCEPRSKQLALQRKNNELKGAQVIVEELDDETYEAAIDSFLPYREENDDSELVMPDSPPAPAAAPPPPLLGGPAHLLQVPSYAVLKLTDLPHYVKEHDIMKTFSDFPLLSITLNSCRISRTKTAYVQFAKPDDARVAFDSRERILFGRRHPTIVAVSDMEFEQVKNMEAMRQEQAAAQEAMARATSPAAPPAAPAAPRDPRQRRAPYEPPAPAPAPLPHQAPGFFVQQFPNHQQNPFPAPFQAPVGFPAAGGFPAGAVGAVPAPGPLDPRANGWGAGGPRPAPPGPFPDGPGPEPGIEDTPLDCILIKGLPVDATDRTIVNFLQPTGAVPALIHLMLDVNGLSTGAAFCEFRTAAEARRAAAKHGTHLEGCRVTVDPVPRAVVEDALEGPKQLDAPPAPDPMEGHMPQVPFFEPGHGGRGRGGTFRGRGGFDRGRGGFDSGRGGFDGGRGGFDGGRGGFEGRGSFRGRGGQRGGFDRGRGSRGGSVARGARNAFDNGTRLDDHDPALDDFGAPGCVVSMENVPFRASIEEILAYFAEFELTQDDVIRRYNDRGQPTGDARVAFRTPFDAQRAVKTRHMDSIHERRITLTIL